MIGLLVDDPEELDHLGRVQGRRSAQHRRGRALDRGQRGPQFVAHQTQELGSRAFQLRQRRQVLQGDDKRLDLAFRGMDRRGVDQRADAPAAADFEDHFLGAHRRRAAEHLRPDVLFQRDLLPVGEPALHDLQQLVRRVGRRGPTPENPAWPPD